MSQLNKDIIQDDISIKMLELMDSVIESKKQLEDVLRNGFIMIGKSRYIMGAQSVSMLRVPSGDCNMECQFYSSVSEVASSSDFPFNYKKFGIHQHIPTDQAMTSKPTDEQNTESAIRKRGSTKVEEFVDTELSISKIADPLQWFSALPSQSLRQAQQHFKQAITLLSQIATFQSQINILNNQLNSLKQRIKLANF